MKIDKAKVKKNAIDVAGLAIGVGLGVVVSNLTKGKLPTKWLEPLVLFIPGVAGAILIDNDLASSVSKGVAVAGAIDGGQKLTSLEALKFAKPLMPKVTNQNTPPLAGFRGLGEVRNPNDVLLGLTGGSQAPAAAWL